MIDRRRNRIEAKETMLLVCQSEAESAYFSQFRKDCRYSNMTIKLKEGSKNTLRALIDSASRQKNRGKYSVCWVCFGFDEVDVKPEDMEKEMEYAERKKVNLLYFNPTFYLYFLLFDLKPEIMLSRNEIMDKLSKKYPGFDGSEKYFLTDGLTLNLKIYPKLAVADANARSYNDMVEIKTDFPATSLPQFLDSVKTVCGKADMSRVPASR